MGVVKESTSQGVGTRIDSCTIESSGSKHPFVSSVFKFCHFLHMLFLFPPEFRHPEFLVTNVSDDEQTSGPTGAIVGCSVKGPRAVEGVGPPARWSPPFSAKGTERSVLIFDNFDNDFDLLLRHESWWVVVFLFFCFFLFKFFLKWWCVLCV